MRWNQGPDTISGSKRKPLGSYTTSWSNYDFKNLRIPIWPNHYPYGPYSPPDSNTILNVKYYLKKNVIVNLFRNQNFNFVDIKIIL